MTAHSNTTDIVSAWTCFRNSHAGVSDCKFFPSVPCCTSVLRRFLMATLFHRTWGPRLCSQPVLAAHLLDDALCLNGRLQAAVKPGIP